MKYYPHGDIYTGELVESFLSLFKTQREGDFIQQFKVRALKCHPMQTVVNGMGHLKNLTPEMYLCTIPSSDVTEKLHVEEVNREIKQRTFCDSNVTQSV